MGDEPLSGRRNDGATTGDQEPSDLLRIDGLEGPLKILKQSIKLVPANKYAFGVVGLVAAVSIAIFLVRGNWQLAIAGGVAMLVSMIVLRLFAVQDAASVETAPQQVPLPAQVLTWIGLVAFALVLVMLIAKFGTILFPSSHAGGDSSLQRLPTDISGAIIDPQNYDPAFEALQDESLGAQHSENSIGQTVQVRWQSKDGRTTNKATYCLRIEAKGSFSLHGFAGYRVGREVPKRVPQRGFLTGTSVNFNIPLSADDVYLFFWIEGHGRPKYSNKFDDLFTAIAVPTCD